MVLTHGEEKHVVTGEKDYEVVGHHFSWTNILAEVLGDKHNIPQCKHRNEAKKWAWAVGEIKTTQDP